MPQFEGKVRLTANPFDLVGARMEVAGGNLALIVSGQQIGEWPLAGTAIRAEIDGFHLSVDGEELVFMTREADGFAAAVGVSRFGTRAQNSRRSGRAVKALKTPSQAAAQAQAAPAQPLPTQPLPAQAIPAPTPRQFQARVTPPRAKAPPAPRPDRIGPLIAKLREGGTKAAMGVAVVVVVLAVIARPLLAGLLLVAGMGGILFIGAAAVDPVLATKLPEGWTAGRLVPIALGVIVAGLLLVAF